MRVAKENSRGGRLGPLGLLGALATLFFLSACGAEPARFSLAVGGDPSLLKEVKSVRLAVYDENAFCQPASGAVNKGRAKALFQKNQANTSPVVIKALTVGKRVFSVIAYRDSFTSVVAQSCDTVMLTKSPTPVAVKLTLLRIGAPPNKIIFVSDRDGPASRGLFIADFDGGNVKRLAVATISGDDYALSSKKSVAFVALAGARPNILTISTDGTKEGKLTPAAGIEVNPAFSKDGSRVVYSANPQGDFDIYSIAASGGSATNKTNAPSTLDSLPAIAPDDSLIAFIGDTGKTGRSRETALYVVDHTGTVNKIHDGPLLRSAPVFAGSGTVLIVAGDPTQKTGPSQVLAIDLATKQQLDLSASPGSRDEQPAVSADGKTVAFVSGRDGDKDIFLVGVDGSGLTKLPSGAGNSEHPSFHPSGEKVIYVNDGDVYEVAVAGGSPKKLISHAALETRPRYLPQ